MFLFIGFIALLILIADSTNLKDKATKEKDVCDYCQRDCATLELKGINTAINLGNSHGHGSQIINSALLADCNRTDSYLQFPGTTETSVRRIVESGHFVGELNCAISSKDVCICENPEICWRGIFGTKVTLIPYCDRTGTCRIYSLITAGKLVLDVLSETFSVHPLADANDPLSMRDLPANYISASSVRCRPTGISCFA